jgi:hypothetical protein
LSVPLIVESVDVEVHVGVPEVGQYRTCPAEPVPYRVFAKVEVASAVGVAAPDVWLTKTVLAFWVASCERAREPEMVERVEVAPEYSLPCASMPTPPAPPVSPVSQVAPVFEKAVVDALLKSAVEEANKE